MQVRTDEGYVVHSYRYHCIVLYNPLYNHRYQASPKAASQNASAACVGYKHLP